MKIYRTRPIIVCLYLLMSCFACNSELYQKKYEAADKTSQAADDLLVATSQLNEQISDRVEENPNSATRDFVPAVEQRTEEIETIKEDSEKIKQNRMFNSQGQFERLRNHQQRLSELNYELSAIGTSLEQELDKKLASDVSFSTGSFVLNSRGKEELETFVYEEIAALIQAWNQEAFYQNKPKKVRVQITGYADLQGPSDVQARHQLNLDLSQRRAGAVKEQVLSCLKKLQENHNLTLEIADEGLGEEPPPLLTDIERVNNPERRVCLISGYVIPVF